jgi:hypothetical protein
MKLINTIVLSLFLITGALAVTVSGQGSAQERAANLHAQLTEVLAKQTELQTRLEQLDEASKPENIEKSLAGVGSTHPEELRAQRRRQLEIEKAGVQAQLDQLAVSRVRLERAVAEADANAYHESAGVKPRGLSEINNSTNTQPTSRHRRHKKIRRRR